MTNAKSFLKSKTIWGAAIAVAPAAAGLFGYSITGANIAEASEHVNAVVTAIGGLLVVVGRVKATTQIGA